MPQVEELREERSRVRLESEMHPRAHGVEERRGAALVRLDQRAKGRPLEVDGRDRAVASRDEERCGRARTDVSSVERHLNGADDGDAGVPRGVQE